MNISAALTDLAADQEGLLTSAQLRIARGDDLGPASSDRRRLDVPVGASGLCASGYARHASSAPALRPAVPRRAELGELRGGGRAPWPRPVARPRRRVHHRASPSTSRAALRRAHDQAARPDRSCRGRRVPRRRRPPAPCSISPSHGPILSASRRRSTAPCVSSSRRPRCSPGAWTGCGDRDAGGVAWSKR